MSPEISLLHVADFAVSDKSDACTDGRQLAHGSAGTAGALYPCSCNPSKSDDHSSRAASVLKWAARICPPRKPVVVGHRRTAVKRVPRYPDTSRTKRHSASCRASWKCRPSEPGSAKTRCTVARTWWVVYRLGVGFQPAIPEWINFPLHRVASSPEPGCVPHRPFAVEGHGKSRSLPQCLKRRLKAHSGNIEECISSKVGFATSFWRVLSW